MVKELCPLLNLDYADIDDEKADKHSLRYMTFKNKEVFYNGSYNVEILLCLGFLLCSHHDRQSRMDEFWQLVNPEINEECSVDRVIEILRVFIYVSIVLRLKIEKSKQEDD